MKDFRGMKRQRSRNRKPSGNQNNPNRAYESNGPEGTKVRGNAQTIYEKYQQLARDANSSGDRVLAENHLQHAEHYFRLIRQMQPQRPVSEFVQRDPFSNGFDDFDDDMDTMEGTDNEAEGSMQGDGDQPSFDDNRNNDNRDNRDRNDRPRFDRDNREGRDRNNNNNRDRNNNRNDRNASGNGNRDRNDRNDRPQNDRPQNDRPQNDRPQERPPYEAREPRTFEPRSPAPVAAADEFDADGNRRESRRERYERRRSQRLNEQEQVVSPAPVTNGFIASTEPLGASRTAAQPDLSFEPKPTAQPTVRDDLPAFLNRPTPVSAAPADAPADEAAKPKRGRPKRKAEAATEEA